VTIDIELKTIISILLDMHFSKQTLRTTLTVNKTSINKSEPTQGGGGQGVSSSQESSQGASSSQVTDSSQENTSPTSHGSEQIQYTDENGTLIVKYDGGLTPSYIK